MKTFYLLFLLSITTVFSQNTKKNELLLPYRDGNLWGLCDTLGTVKVKPFTTGMVDFVTIPPDFNGKYVIKKNGKISIIDQYKKELLVETSLDSVKMRLFSKVVVMYKNNKKGLLWNFKMLIPVQYDDVEFAENESFVVGNKGEKGLVNSEGKLIIPVVYTTIHESWSKNRDKNSTKFYWIAKNENSDGKGEEVNFTDNKVVKEKMPEWSVPPVINELQEMEENNRIRIEKKYGKVVSFLGKINMYIVKTNEGYGVYDANKNKIILKSDTSIEFSESNNGYAIFLMKKNGKMGLIDETGKVLLDYEYDSIEKQWGGVCILWKDNKKGLFVLDSIYKPVQPKYKEIKILKAIPVSDSWKFGVFEVTTEAGKKGLLGENGVEYFKN